VLGGLFNGALAARSPARVREATRLEALDRRGRVARIAGCSLREETVLLVPAIVAWGFFAFRSIAFAARAKRVGAFIGGLALILVPVAGRNAAVGGEFVLTTAQAGPNFYMGNNPNADGTYAPLLPGRGDAQ
jgi:uncharacterized YccA/Bax inhibitor family protein